MQIIKVNKMDGDSKKIKTNTKAEEPPNVLQGFIANVSDVLSAFRLRCPIQIDNGSKRIVLDSRYRVLFYLSIIFYILLLLKA
jgi:hypothetical protein